MQSKRQWQESFILFEKEKEHGQKTYMVRSKSVDCGRW